MVKNSSVLGGFVVAQLAVSHHEFPLLADSCLRQHGIVIVSKHASLI